MPSRNCCWKTPTVDVRVKHLCTSPPPPADSCPYRLAWLTHPSDPVALQSLVHCKQLLRKSISDDSALRELDMSCKKILDNLIRIDPDRQRPYEDSRRKLDDDALRL
jgi:hypothetical protein